MVLGGNEERLQAKWFHNTKHLHTIDQPKQKIEANVAWENQNRSTKLS
jgi:hypothetical protein